MTIRFLLKSERKDQPVPVWVRVRTRNADVSLSLDTVIMPATWDAKKGMPRTYNRETEPDLYRQNRELSQYLDNLKDAVVVFVDQLEEKGEKLTKELLAKAIDRRKEKKGEEVPRAIIPYIDWLIEQMRAGSFKFNADNYDYDTVKVWVVFRNVWEKFEADFESATGRVLVWSSIDKAVFDAFSGYMDNYGYSIKTQNKYIICLKAAIKYSCIYHHLHSNTDCLKDLHKKKEVEGCSTTKVYLNDAELQALFEMSLEAGSLYDQVRDVFLVGCYTCQRISDYNNLSRSNFSTTANGTHVVRLIQEKTNNSVVIPILNNNLQAIAEKYNYCLPRLNSVVFNRYIKTICKELSATVETLKQPVKTILTLPEKQAEQAGKIQYQRDEAGNIIRPKYELVTSHSARRSGITNLYRSGLFNTRQMMSISGHKSEASFFLYIAESSDELADEIAGIMEAAKNQAGKSNEDLF